MLAHGYNGTDVQGDVSRETLCVKYYSVGCAFIDIPDVSAVVLLVSGYGNWPLEIQPELGKIIKTEQIGLQVTENYLLFPRKSVTAIIGLMPGDQCLTTKRGSALAHKKIVNQENFQKKQQLQSQKQAKQQLKHLVYL